MFRHLTVPAALRGERQVEELVAYADAVPHVSRDERQRLLRAWHAGDTIAERRLKDVVLHFALRYALSEWTPRDAEAVDFIQLCLAVALETLEKWDGRTHLSKFIGYGLMRGVPPRSRALWMDVYVPMGIWVALLDAARAQRAISLREVATSEIPPRMRRQCRRAARALKRCPLDEYSAVERWWVDDVIDRVSTGQRVRAALLLVTDQRRRMVLTSRVGYPDGEPKKLRELADDLGVSVERVRQIESAAIKQILSGTPKTDGCAG